jgi:hypothetical protein
MQTLAEPNVLHKSADGDWYSLPTNQVDHFISLRELMIETDPSSDEYFGLYDRLQADFCDYLQE